MQVGNKTIKKIKEEIKNTKIYPGSPFLKGYIQSFANYQRFPLKRSQDQFTTLAPSKLSLLPAVHTATCSTHTLLNPTADVKPVQKPTAPTQLQTQ